MLNGDLLILNPVYFWGQNIVSFKGKMVCLGVKASSGGCLLLKSYGTFTLLYFQESEELVCLDKKGLY